MTLGILRLPSVVWTLIKLLAGSVWVCDYPARYAGACSIREYSARWCAQHPAAALWFIVQGCPLSLAAFQEWAVPRLLGRGRFGLPTPVAAPWVSPQQLLFKQEVTVGGGQGPSLSTRHGQEHTTGASGAAKWNQPGAVP